MQRVDLNDGLIWFPRENTAYHISLPGHKNCETIVTFKGECNQYAYFDVFSASFLSKDEFYSSKWDEPSYITDKEIFFMPRESLPPSIANNNFSPVMIYKKSTGELIDCEAMDVIIENGDGGFGFDFQFGNNNYLRNCSETIQKECQLLAKKIPVVIGAHPIFLEKNRPNREFLENLYQEFLLYNTKEKLEEEHLGTKNKCHLRAHMVFLFLSQYGIDSFKVFKFWHPEDWTKFADKQEWYFHCAVMLIDADNNKWIWDPWVGFNERLLTLDEWLNRKTEPTPYKLLITNRAIFGDHEKGRLTETTHFVERNKSKIVGKLQYLFGAAIPNPPELPIPTLTTLVQNNTLLFNNSVSQKLNEPLWKKPTVR